MPGSDRDSHGCVASAGYTWCSQKNKCLRSWEESCDGKNLEEKKNSEAGDKIANPASVNCEKVGGKLEIVKNGAGAEYGICNFADGRACEEWALLRKECPEGGVKLTGFDTDAQKYCALVGGKTTAVADAKCTLLNGKICGVDDLFNGKCVTE